MGPSTIKRLSPVHCMTKTLHTEPSLHHVLHQTPNFAQPAVLCSVCWLYRPQSRSGSVSTDTTMKRNQNVWFVTTYDTSHACVCVCVLSLRHCWSCLNTHQAQSHSIHRSAWNTSNRPEGNLWIWTHAHKFSSAWMQMMPRLFDYIQPHVGCFHGPIKIFVLDICGGSDSSTHTKNGVGRHQRFPRKLFFFCSSPISSALLFSSLSALSHLIFQRLWNYVTARNN